MIAEEIARPLHGFVFVCIRASPGPKWPEPPVTPPKTTAINSASMAGKPRTRQSKTVYVAATGLRNPTPQPSPAGANQSRSAPTFTSGAACAPCTLETLPTVLRSGPYRLFFYSADRDEPAHVHVEREEAEAKFWPFLCAWSGAAVSVARNFDGLSRSSKSRAPFLRRSCHEYFGN